jgi:N6-adenosine-specific RNA methylase IME4
MTVDAILELPVADLAAADCRLFLWVTPELYREGVGVQVARAWGFTPADELIWEKPNFGMGRFPRRCHEPCLVAQRGKPELRGPLDVRSVQRWSQRHVGNGGGKMHSAKPDGLLDLAEARSPGPYLEMFARRQRLGWDTWGNEALEHVTMSVPK